MSRLLLKEVRNIGIMTFTMGIIQFGIVSACGYFGLPAFFGTLLGCAVAVINFALMGMILEMCMNGKGTAVGLSGFGYIFRMVLIAVVVVWAMKVSYLNYVCVVIPLVFPQISIFILNYIRRKNGDKNERT